MSIDPKDAKPDQPYEVTVGGKRRVGQRVDPGDPVPWAVVEVPGGVEEVWFADGSVSELTPLVPARPVTRADLPSEPDIQALAATRVSHGESVWGRIMDAVVAHLNENGGIPEEKSDTWGHCSLGQETGTLTQRLRELGFKPGGGTVGNGFNVHSKSCCEEAQLTANELARRNEELSEAEGEIAALTKNRERAETRYRETLERLVEVDGAWNEMRKDRNGQKVRAEKAEAERDEARESASRANELAATCQRERDEWESNADELQAKLDAAENRPTLDREAVENVVNGATCGQLSWDEVTYISSEIMALVPASEGWPEWLGPKIDHDDYDPERIGGVAFRVDGRVVTADSAEVARESAKDYLRVAASYAAVARFIESEQAATGDEDQRVEEQAKALGAAVSRYHGDWDNFSESARERYRDAIRAGWTPPESEAGA